MGWSPIVPGEVDEGAVVDDAAAGLTDERGLRGAVENLVGNWGIFKRHTSGRITPASTTRPPTAAPIELRDGYPLHRHTITASADNLDEPSLLGKDHVAFSKLCRCFIRSSARPDIGLTSPRAKMEG